ncbi:hypothetical protein BO79DRAFT_31971 [Aspergillus costaricaensis CBS 115574]|uniref:Uncharacterized protein n=1 Tax=Aspergillus costaricaensis CBS 115574 TaxID=1448317 RepID=A0ACD1IBK3_9EURO|nr:hypothetical protein BO79DRAFT_31971 [Aspergillus costaricaensis CBS 115574]RAK87147.1 hypothetical protein BO79DRAFT_31971 [Aspergillus costaricaensis CBS 115574]
MLTATRGRLRSSGLNDTPVLLLLPSINSIRLYYARCVGAAARTLAGEDPSRRTDQVSIALHIYCKALRSRQLRKNRDILPSQARLHWSAVFDPIDIDWMIRLAPSPLRLIRTCSYGSRPEANFVDDIVEIAPVNLTSIMEVYLVCRTCRDTLCMIVTILCGGAFIELQEHLRISDSFGNSTNLNAGQALFSC